MTFSVIKEVNIRGLKRPHRSSLEHFSSKMGSEMEGDG